MSKVKKRLLGTALAIVMVFGLVGGMGKNAYAYSPGSIAGTTGSGTENDPVIVDNFAELKAALELKEDLYIRVDRFDRTYGYSYYRLEPGVDYQHGGAAFTIPSGYTKHLEINTVIDFRATSGSTLLYSLIYNQGWLFISGNGEIRTSFNSTGYPNAIIFNACVLHVNDIILNATQNTFSTYGYAIWQYSTSSVGVIESGTFYGSNKNENLNGGIAAVNCEKSMDIYGGRFICNDAASKGYGLTIRCDSMNISGGEFQGINSNNQAIGNYIKSGYLLIKSSDNSFVDTTQKTTKETVKVVEAAVSDVNVNVAVPVGGNNPGTPTLSTPNTSLTAWEWYDANSNPITLSDTFVEGDKYKLHVIVKPQTGFHFANNVSLHFNESLNGTEYIRESDAINYYYEFEAENPYSGTTGDCHWDFKSSTGTLTISGNGAMADYTNASGAPWYSVSGNITNLVIGDGVTHIGDYAFAYTKISSLSIPDSVNSIGHGSFLWCTKLDSVNLGNGVTKIGSGAFCNNTKNGNKLTSITIPSSVTTLESKSIGYRFWYGDNKYEKIEGYTVTGVCGSAAETYAKENGLVWVSNAHSLTKVTAVAATTTTEGNKEYYTCSCGKWFEDAAGTKEIADHSSVIIPKVQESSGGSSGGDSGNGTGNNGGSGNNGTENNDGSGNNGTGENSANTPKNTLVTTDGKLQYYKEDGSIARNEWITINNISYYFNADGYNASNEWVDGKWISEDGTCTYEGELTWKCNSTGWWVEDSKGWYPVASWQKIDGIWYYFNASGYMAANEYVDGYWLNGDGSCSDDYYLTWKCNATGWWVEDKSGWWPSSQWLKIDGCWYYFNASGYMVTSQYVDGYWIGADGVCK